MISNDDLSNPLGQLGSIPKKTGEQFLKEPAEAIEEVEVQTGAKPPASSTTAQDDNKTADDADKTAIPSKKDTLEIIRKMYEASDTKVSVPSDKIISKVIEENPKKTPEELQKIATTRQQLLQQQHMSTYFEPTFNPPKKPQEERAAEKMEKEEKEKKQMEALEFQKEEKKKEELAPTVKQGTHEKYPGVAG